MSSAADCSPIGPRLVLSPACRGQSITGKRLAGLRSLYGSDRGFFSEQNLASCKHAGVKLVCIPQRGGKRTPRRQAYESSAAFKNGQRFRAGIEGRISVLFRGRGMKRCLAEGRDRFELWVGAAVLANNLMQESRHY